MAWALEQAQRAAEQGEVPVGAALVLDGALLAADHNRTRARRDPSAHAELLAVRSAAQTLGHERLGGVTVYSTLEPCFMCAGLLVHARVARVVFATRDPKFGACVSLGRVLDHPRANHRCAWQEGLGAEASRALLVRFFRELRAARRPR
jgi:tRNA(adenine34) deaminase